MAHVQHLQRGFALALLILHNDTWRRSRYLSLGVWLYVRYAHVLKHAFAVLGASSVALLVRVQSQARDWRLRIKPYFLHLSPVSKSWCC